MTECVVRQGGSFRGPAEHTKWWIVNKMEERAQNGGPLCRGALPQDYRRIFLYSLCYQFDLATFHFL